MTGLKHVDGAISMARAKPGSATSSFFICVNDQPELDFGGKRNPDGQGFAAFGRVVKGMDVVRAIQALPAQGQQLAPPVKIISVRRIDSIKTTSKEKHHEKEPQDRPPSSAFCSSSSSSGRPSPRKGSSARPSTRSFSARAAG